MEGGLPSQQLLFLCSIFVWIFQNQQQQRVFHQFVFN